MSKVLVESCLSLSTFKLNKLGLLTGDWTPEQTLTWKTPQGAIIGSVKVCAKPMGISGGSVELTHTCQDKKSGILTHCKYMVGLTTTPCNYGEDSIRYWFLCPLSHKDKLCGKRVGTLYRPPGELYFGCRHCYNLSYASRNVSRAIWDNLLDMWLNSGGSREDW